MTWTLAHQPLVYVILTDNAEVPSDETVLHLRFLGDFRLFPVDNKNYPAHLTFWRGMSSSHCHHQAVATMKREQRTFPREANRSASSSGIERAKKQQQQQKRFHPSPGRWTSAFLWVTSRSMDEGKAAESLKSSKPHQTFHSGNLIHWRSPAVGTSRRRREWCLESQVGVGMVTTSQKGDVNSISSFTLGFYLALKLFFSMHRYVWADC